MAAVTYSPFWGPAVDAYSLLVNVQPRVDTIRHVIHRQGFRVSKALLGGLIGAATGSNVTATHAEIGTGTTTTAGGVATPGAGPVNTVTDINRNTAAADVTALKAFLVNYAPKPAFPRDLSGNGGPAQS